MQEKKSSIHLKIKSSSANVLFYILLFITILTPLFFIPVTFIPIQFGTSLFFAFGVILAILIYIARVLFCGSIELPNPSKYILGFMVLVPSVYLLAGLSNGFSRMSFFGYTFDISTVGFMMLGFSYLFLISLLFRSKNRIFYSYLAFLVSSIALSVFIIIRIIFGAKILSFGIFSSITSTPIGSWNNAGIFFGIGVILPLITYQMISVGKSIKVLLFISTISSLFFLALVNFETIWIIIAIYTFVFILYRLFSGGVLHPESLSLKERFLKIPFYTSIVFIISVAFIVWGNVFGAYISKSFNISNVEVRPALSVTLDIARNTLKDKPIFGSGPNTFTAQWLTWKPDDVVTTVFWNTDFTNGVGLIPTFAVTTGVLGILSWLLFLGFFLYLGIKSFFTDIKDGFIKYLTTSSFFIAFYLWIMSFVYIPSTVIFILTLFFTGLFFASIYLSKIINVETKTFSIDPRTGFLSSLILTSSFLASLVLGYGLFKNSQSLWYFQKSSNALNSLNNPNLSEIYMTKAISSVPSDIYFRALSEIELTKLSAILSQDSKNIKPEEVQKQFSETLTKAINAGMSAKNTDSSNYLNWVALGRVYEAVSIPELKIQGAYESAKLAYTEAFRRNLKNPGILILLSRAAIVNNNLKEAKDYALQAIQLKNNYIDAYLLLSQIEVSNKNIKGAVDSIAAASVIDPTNSEIFFQLGTLRYNSKDFDGAVEALEKSVGLTPDYANAKYFLGLSYEQVGSHDKAISQFEDLKVSNPGNQEVLTILANLKSGRSAFANTKETQ